MIFDLQKFLFIRVAIYVLYYKFYNVFTALKLQAGIEARENASLLSPDSMAD